jgi:hypothetical protein
MSAGRAFQPQSPGATARPARSSSPRRPPRSPRALFGHGNSTDFQGLDMGMPGAIRQLNARLPMLQELRPPTGGGLRPLYPSDIPWGDGASGRPHQVAPDAFVPPRPQSRTLAVPHSR